MNESTSKRLAEFIGVCWHEWRNVYWNSDCINPLAQYKCKLCSKLVTVRGSNLTAPINVDFTDGNGWQLIANEIEKRGEWEKLYIYVWCGGNCIRFMSPKEFHEKQPSEKSTIVAEWLTTKPIE